MCTSAFAASVCMLPTELSSDLSHLMTSLGCSVHSHAQRSAIADTKYINQIKPCHRTVHGKLQEFYKKNAVTRVQR